MAQRDEPAVAAAGAVGTAPEFQAFRSEVVVESFPRTITSLCLWGDQVVVGLQDGTLLFFQRAPDAPLFATGAWQVVKAHRDVERKAVLQMLAVTYVLPGQGASAHGSGKAAPPRQRSGTSTGGSPVASPSPSQSSTSLADEVTAGPAGKGDAPAVAPPVAKPLLLSLTDDGVNLRSLPDAMLRFQAARTKNATCFAWHAGRGAVVVGVRKRVLLLRLRARERPGGGFTGGVQLEEVMDVSAPDAPQTMMFAGDSLFVGCKKAYYLMQLSGGATLPHESSDAAAAVAAALVAGAVPAAAAAAAITPLQLALQPGEVCMVGTAPGPAITLATNSGEVLLARDATVLCVDLLGNPTRRQPITFSAPPAALVAGGHYVVALLPGMGVEVRGLRRAAGSVVHHLIPSLAEAKIIAGPGPAADGSIVLGMAGDAGVRRLVPVALAEQAHMLACSGEYSAALALAALLQDDPDVPRDQWEELEDRLRLLFAHHLFAEGAYDEGMAQLALCSARVDAGQAVLALLRMLPSLVAPHLRHLLPSSVAGAQLPQVREPTGAEFTSAASLTLPYLTSFRSRTMAAHPELIAQRAAHLATRPPLPVVHEGPGSSTPPTPPRAATGNGSSGAHAEVAGDEADPTPPRPSLPQLLAVVDTAMVGAMLAQAEDTGTLLRFVQIAPNWVDLQEGERLLHGSGRYAELAALYKYHGLHDSALEVLRACSQAPDAMVPRPTGAAADLRGMPGVWAAVRYITHLTSAQAPLIRLHSGWILDADPEAGLQAFLQMRQPLEPSLALDILHTQSPAYSGMYLEAALEMGVAAPQDYHSELLLIYLRELLDCEESPANGSALSSGSGSAGSIATSGDDGGEGDAADGGDSGVKDAGPAVGAAATGEGEHPHTWGASANPVVLISTAYGFMKRAVRVKASSSTGSLPALQQQQQQQQQQVALGATQGSDGVTPLPSPADVPKTDTAPRRSSAPMHAHQHSATTAAEFVGATARALRPAARTTSADGATTAAANVPLQYAANGLGRARRTLSAWSARSAGAASLRMLLDPRTPYGSPPTGSLYEPLPLFPDAAPAGGGRLTAQTELAAALVPGGAADGRKQRRRKKTKAKSGEAALAVHEAHAVARSGAMSEPPVLGASPAVTDGEESAAEGLPGAGSPTLPRVRVTPGPDAAATEEEAQEEQHQGERGPLLPQQPPVVPPVKTAALRPPHRHRKPLYRRLRELVFSSPYLDPQQVLAKLPPGDLHEIRALMLERLGHHSAALRLYCLQLDDMALAEAYCDRVYEKEMKRRGSSDPGDSSGTPPREPLAAPRDIYLTLLRVVLELPDVQAALQPVKHALRDPLPLPRPPDEACCCPAIWHDLVWVLSRKAGQLDLPGVLSFIPPAMPLMWLLPLLGAGLAHVETTRRNAAVLRQLRKSENLALRESVGAGRAARILMTPERTCCICYKRVGLAVFVALPDLSIAHYQCYKRRHPEQPTVVLQPAAASIAIGGMSGTPGYSLSPAAAGSSPASGPPRHASLLASTTTTSITTMTAPQDRLGLPSRLGVATMPKYNIAPSDLHPASLQKPLLQSSGMQQDMARVNGTGDTGDDAFDTRPAVHLAIPASLLQ